MDVSELRQRILRALEASQPDAATRRDAADAAAHRAEGDAARRAFEFFLAKTAVPLLRQAQGILKAEGHAFTVFSPAEGARLVSDASPETFLEFELDSTDGRYQVIARTSLVRRDKRVVVEERPLAASRPVADLGDDDVAAFLVTEIPKMVARS